MKVICERGFFKFYPESTGEVAQFENTFKRSLVARGDYYTFEKLAPLPDYSIQGQTYGGIPAKVNYAGRVEDVFYQNKLKYNIYNDIIQPNDNLEIVGERANNYIWVVTGIAPAYAQLQDKTVISGYQGFINVIYGYTTIIGWENADI